jgi:hypothetical protein
MIKTMAIAAALVTVSAPATATTYSFAYQTGAGLLTDKGDKSTLNDRDAIAGKAVHPRPAANQRTSLHGLIGVTSVALGTAIDGSVQNFCAAMQTDCSGVGFAVVTSLAPLEGIAFTSASDLFATYLVKTRSTAAAARVPEPANWALWIAGFGALGMMQRRRALRTV